MGYRHDRYVAKIAGESGQGISSVGEILAKALKELGYKVFEYREYPSLIRGGFATSQIDISGRVVQSSRLKCDLLICMSRVSLHEYLQTVEENGTILHALSEVKFSEAEQMYLEENNIDVHFTDVFKLAVEIGGDKIFANQILLGLVWQKIKQPIDKLKEIVEIKFGKKKEFLPANLASVEAGYSMHLPGLHQVELDFEQDQNWKDSILIKGNEAVGLGAIAAGVRAYFGYPMTPSTSIMGTLSKFYHDTGIVVKQAEDEITAAQMTIGAMFAGTRALTATSGGGFDLMTESVSLAGMTETPFVCVIAQRPGPATGLPTWTGAGDLNIAIYSGHGEFARCVIAVSDAQSSFEQIQHALNIAEEYQMVVILLTEKQIGESMFNVGNLGKRIEIKRGIINDPNDNELNSHMRFEITESGISRRWIPGSSKVTYLANSDEHIGDGSLTEQAEPSAAMYAKRIRKEDTLLKQLPEPEIIGNPDADNVIIGWGSTKNAVVDAFNVMANEELTNVMYLHYEYLYPVCTETLQKLYDRGATFHLMEGNYLGQLGNLLKQYVPIKFKHQFMKYDGRAFFIDETVDFILKVTEN